MDEVFETTFYFMVHDDVLVQKDALHALGAVCIRHYDYMLKSKLKSLYIDILNEDFYCVQHKIKARTFLRPRDKMNCPEGFVNCFLQVPPS